MLKLVVLCVFLAAVAAEPGVVISPLAYKTTVISPASTTINHQASSVIHPSPLVYSAPLAYDSPLAYAHFIKKRSAAFAYTPLIAPATYFAKAPLTTYTAPLSTYTSIAPLTTGYTSPVYTSAHLIKKRSPSAILPITNSYVAPTFTAAQPLVTSYTHSVPLLHSPIVSLAPVPYSHFIKKRSAPFALTYAAPASFYPLPRADIRTAPVVTSHIPLIHSSPIAIASHFV